MAALWQGYRLKGGVITDTVSGTQTRFDKTLFSEIKGWLPFYLSERWRAITGKNGPKRNIKIAFLPTQPRPWYILWVLSARANVKLVSTAEAADIVFYFEDKTLGMPPALPAGCTAKTLNFGCADISKSKVAKVFEDVFGYGLSVDPQSYSGMMAVKSDKNGTHDGAAVQGPVQPEPGKVYQRLIDNSISSDLVMDMRCAVVGGEIEIIFVKHRLITDRFSISNAKVILKSPGELLSVEERKTIKAFAKAMGLDFGGMDILRNNEDGKIYIVDVNKTDIGPSFSLPIADKNRAAEILTDQFIKLITS